MRLKLKLADEQVGTLEAVDAAIAEYLRLSPYATGDTLAVSSEFNRMIAAAINANPRWFWDGPEAVIASLCRKTSGGAISVTAPRGHDTRPVSYIDPARF